SLIYLVIIVAVVYIPAKLGGWDTIFSAAATKFDKTPSPADGLLLPGSGQLQYATLALGSALALFLYPHSVTGVLAARDRNTIKRTMRAWPASPLRLAWMGLLGTWASAVGTKPTGTGTMTSVTGVPVGPKPTGTPVVPLLFSRCSRTGSPGWPSPPWRS